MFYGLSRCRMKSWQSPLLKCIISMLIVLKIRLKLNSQTMTSNIISFIFLTKGNIHCYTEYLNLIDIYTEVTYLMISWIDFIHVQLTFVVIYMWWKRVVYRRLQTQRLNGLKHLQLDPRTIHIFYHRIRDWQWIIQINIPQDDCPQYFLSFKCKSFQGPEKT